MTELTTQQIGQRLQRDDLGAAAYQELMNAITARRRQIKARLEQIEGVNSKERKAATSTCDMTKLFELNRESERLDDELGILSELETRVYRLHTSAHERETIDAARRGRKQLPALIESASKALAKYRDARRQLTDAIEAMGGARRLCWDTDREAFEVPDSVLTQLGEVLYVDLPADRLAGALGGLRQRICAPPAPIYSDAPPDLAAQVQDIMSPYARRDRGAG